MRFNIVLISFLMVVVFTNYFNNFLILTPNLVILNPKKSILSVLNSHLAGLT
ncbi:hypothetical protein GGTG_10812 [Gaeumannomyces tritici R3-111a-1]|uniref:Uncharacterized protein n=1 Tax=Gaeumannomyces tritici (strain R3-111a-1) TaxID=644352 RepID=J3PBD9_GAET3|nr:hypothetical protein GGTG_10812 [Gaeumannomyces tritici R3-111a-1]EJT71555.1 hypothetical protein GGTG_10812 [Gaeumannomyces tritici R3-111a-1]